MDNNRKYFETIRAYILGRLSEEESLVFKKELESNTSLREEYERMKDISIAAKRVSARDNLRAMMSQAESELEIDGKTKDRGELNIDLAKLEQELSDLYPENNERPANILKRTWEWIKAWFTPREVVIPTIEAKAPIPAFSYSYFSRMALSLAAVASLTLLVILPINYNKMANAGFNEAGRMINMPPPDGAKVRSSIDQSTVAIDSLISAAVEEIEGGDYSKAQADLSSAEMIVDSIKNVISDDDSSIFRQRELEQQRQTIVWYRALLLMRDKKVTKARYLLKEISNSHSPYAEDASRILHDVY